jgi:hypothetical protein
MWSNTHVYLNCYFVLRVSVLRTINKNDLVNIWTIFASQGLRFGSPFSPPLADLEYILKFARNATWWFIEVAPLRKSSSPANQNRFVIRMLESWRKTYLWYIQFGSTYCQPSEKFQRFGRRERCFHWNQNGKWHLCLHFVDNMCSV